MVGMDKTMDEKDRLRQLYLRTLLGLGITWGCALFIAAPFIFRGKDDTTFEVCMAVFNSVTIMPACILAFWHRRMACIWLTVNAIGIVFAWALSINRIRSITVSIAIGLAVPVLIAATIDWMELRSWPKALQS